MQANRQGTDLALLGVAVIAAVHLALSAFSLGWLLAPLAPAILFYGLGAALKAAWVVLRGIPQGVAGSARRFLSDTLASVIVTSAVATTLALAWSLTAAAFALAVDGSVLLSVGIVLAKAGTPRKLTMTPLQRTTALPFLVLASAASILFAIWRWATPYPIVPGWDMHTALVSIDFMLSHHGFGYVLIPPFPVTTDFPYPGMYLDLIAGVSLYMGWDPLLVYWWAPLFLLLGFMALTFAITYRFSQATVPSLTVAILAALASGAEPDIVRGPFFLQVDMLAGLVLLLILAWFSFQNTPSTGRTLMSVLAWAFLGLFYYYTLVPAFPFAVYMILSGRPRWSAKHGLGLFATLYLMLFTVLGVVAIVGGQGSSGLQQFINPAIFPLELKTSVLLAIYVPAVLVGLLLALPAFIAHRRAHPPSPLGIEHFAIAALSLFGAYWLPVWVTYRFELYLRFFVLIFLSASAWGLPRAWSKFIVLRFPRAVSVLGSTDRQARLGWTVAIVLVVAISASPLAPVLRANATTLYSYYTQNEFSMAVWIESHLPADAYLATDPGSGYLFRSLAQRNGSYFVILPDGRAPAIGDTILPGVNHEVYLAVNTTFVTQNSTTAARILGSIKVPDMYVLLTSRTYYWATQADENLTLTAPVPNQDTLLLAELFRGGSFTQVQTVGDVFLIRFAP